MGQTIAPRKIQKEDFWKNPWDVGGLIVVGLFTSTLLLLFLFAVVFGYVEKAVRKKAVRKKAVWKKAVWEDE